MSRYSLAPPRPATDAEIAAVAECLRSGWLTMGPRTQAFEAAFAEFTGAPHAVAVGSGTAAIHLACLAARVGRGDEVVVAAQAPPAVAEAPAWCGAEVVVEGGDLDLAARVGVRTKAVIVSHRWGLPADLRALREACERHGAVLIEDATEALGADGVGAGDLTCFAFGEGQLVAVGEGGMVTAADESRAARVRSLRGHALTSGTWDRHRGHAAGYDVVDIGFNYRMDEARAALGTARLAGALAELERRRAVAARYAARLPGPDPARAACAVYVASFPGAEERDRAEEKLARGGVETAPAGRLCLLLPVAGMTESGADAVCDLLQS